MNSSSIPSINYYWAVIPAAGVGKRMRANLPKQYLPLAGKTVLEQTLSVFINHPRISGIVIAVSKGDSYWQDMENNIRKQLKSQDKLLIVADGGNERCHSVLNALQSLSQQVSECDWVLVHDAARPCLSIGDIDKLIDQLGDSDTGGLLGLPMSDTVKRCNSNKEVLETVDRSTLWRALTPQMFPLKLLMDSLQQAIADEALVTDEASAIELQGLRPIMVEGQPGNLKITHPGDLQLAEMFLSQLKTS